MNELLHDIELLKQGKRPDSSHQLARIELLISQVAERKPKGVWRFLKDNIDIKEVLKTMSARELKALEDDLLEYHRLDNWKIARIFKTKLPNKPI